MKAIWKWYYKYNKKQNKNIPAYRTLDFGNYEVKECSKTFFGVYDSSGTLITSATTFKRACKKAELLQKGYNDGQMEGYCEGLVDAIEETEDD